MVPTFKQYMKQLNLLSLRAFSDLPTPRKLVYFKKYRTLRYMGTCECCGDVLYSSEEEHQLQEDCRKYVEQMKDVLDVCENV